MYSLDRRLQYPGPWENYFKKNSLVDDSDGDAFYLDPDTLETVTVPAGTPFVHPEWGLTGFDEYTQLIRKSEDISDGVWSGQVSFTGVTATQLKATVQYANITQQISTLDGELYTLSFVASVESGGQTGNYSFAHENSATVGDGALGRSTLITLTEIPTPYSVTVLGKSGDGNVAMGFKDENTSNWSKVTITKFQVTETPNLMPYAPNDSDTDPRAIASRAGTITASEGRADGPDLLDGWDFTDGWSKTGSTTTNSSSSFTSPGNGGVQKEIAGLTVGDIYDVTVELSSTASSVQITNDIGGVVVVGTGSGTYRFTAGSGYIYVRNVGAGTTTISNFTVKQVTNTTLQTAYPKLYSALDGAVTGANLRTATSGWTLNTGWTSSGTYNITTDGTAASAYDDPLTEGTYYEVKIKSITGSGTIGARVGKTTYTPYVIAQGEIITIRSEAVIARLAVEVDSLNDFIGELEILSIKQIAPGSAVHELDWRPGVDYGDTGATGKIFTVDGSTAILRHLTNGKLQLKDGTGAAEVYFNYQAGTTYPIRLVYGMKSDDTLSSEKVTDGTFVEACGVNWTCQSGWAIANNKATATASTDRINQAMTTEIGKIYQLVFTVSDYGGGSVRPVLGDNASASIITGNGDYIVDLESLATDAKVVFDGVTAFTGSISNVSFKQTNQPKMQLQVYKDGAWQVSAVKDFVGTFSPEDALTFFLGNDYLNSINNYKVRKLSQSDWRTP